MTTFVHNSSGTLNISQKVSGAGTTFGSKSHQAPTIVDFGEAGVGNLSSHWTTAKPSGTAAGTLPRNRSLPHDNNGTSSGVPHSRCSIATCGAAPGGGAPYDTTNMFLSRDFIITSSDLPSYSFWTFYDRFANNWHFQIPDGIPDGNTDNNCKHYGYSTANDGIYGGLPYNWYSNYSGEENANPNLLQNNTNEPIELAMNDDSPGGIGGGGVLDNWADHWSPTIFKNPAKAWIRREILVKWSTADGGGFYRERHNNGTLWDYVSRTESLSIGNWANNTGGNYQRSEGIGGFRRSTHAENMTYFADIIHDRDPNPARIVFTNNATYASSTILEVQPYTAWSTSESTFTVKGGALAAGTIHAHLINEVDGNIYFGSHTLSDEGGGGGGGPAPLPSYPMGSANYFRQALQKSRRFISLPSGLLIPIAA